jgi:energy-coupling factor transporter transmembrane protein EcfT
MRRGTCAVTLHPASLLLAWVVAVIALQQLSLSGLALAAAVIVPCVTLLALARARHLLRRSRWLLFSLALLFAFGTPGRLIPPIPWLTLDGLELAIEHVLRLSLLLLLLALLLQRLELDRLMSGLFLLLAPFVLLGFDRSKAVARLMLVLDYVQSGHGKAWRDWLAPSSTEAPSPLTLTLTPIRGADYAAIALLMLCVILGVIRSP